MPRIVPGLPEVRTLPAAAAAADGEPVQAFQEVGGLVGRFALAFLAIRIVSRRQAPAHLPDPRLIVVAAGLLRTPARRASTLAKWGMFLAGFFTVAQFSFWGNYLPRVYPTHLRGTGEGFAANIGGRMIGHRLRVRHDAA